MLYQVTVNLSSNVISKRVGNTEITRVIPHSVTVDADNADIAEMKAAPRPYNWDVHSVQVCPTKAPKRLTPHLQVPSLARKGKRVKHAHQNVPSKWFGNTAVLSGLTSDGEEIAGELSLDRHAKRGLKSVPLPNALKFTSPVAVADKKRFVAVPRREWKHTLVMSGKGYRVQYQGLDASGRPVWGDSTAL